MVKHGEDGSMPYTRGNGVELYYETVGDDDGVPLLLVNGLGSQLVSWPGQLCAALCDRGFRLVRFDNRDVGLSSRISADGVELMASITAAVMGKEVDAPYLLRDMAADAMAVLDAVGVESAHILGVSMGGMIVQQIAIDHPTRMRSLTSISSTTGDRDVGQPHADVVRVLYERPPTERDAYIAHSVEVSRAIGSPSLFDEDLARAKAELAFDRGLSPEGTGRQLLAILASGSRSDALRRIDIPTLVIHGDADPLVDPTGGRRTAEVISGAELMVLPGMGHDLPAVYWSPIVEAVTALAARADGVPAAEAR